MRAGRGSLAAALLLVGTVACGDGGSREIPTAVVERADFAHVVPADGNLQAVQATQVSLAPSRRPRRSRIAWLKPDGSRVEAGEVVIRLDPSELEDQLEGAEDSLDTVRLDIRKHRVEAASRLSGLDRDADQARLELEMAQEFAELDESTYSRHEIIESQIDGELARRRVEHAQSNRQTEESLAASQLELLDIERRQAQSELEEAEDGLAALEVAAPHAGILVLSRNWRGETIRVGDDVFPGRPLARIPDLSEMEALVYVLEADAGGLAEGRPAKLRIEAFPDHEFDAEIRQVSAVAQPRMRESPTQYFSVTLALQATDPERMRPGQRVRAQLYLAEVEDALVIPRQALFEVDGKPVVYRGGGADFEPVEVVLGPSSPGRVVIESGLEAGDQVALADPTGGAAPAASTSQATPVAAPAGGASPALGGRS